jgi:hypothetical protein
MKASDAVGYLQDFFNRLFVAQFSHFHIMRSDRYFAENVTEMGVLAALILKLMELCRGPDFTSSKVPRKF